MAKTSRVARPQKRSEYELRFASRQASVGWTDLMAVQRSSLTDAWDFLTKTPTHQSPKNHPLRGELGTVVRDGQPHQQWQHELSGGARIWFYVDERIVHLVAVHTAHPNQTK